MKKWIISMIHKKKEYDKIDDYCDKRIFIDTIIKNNISKGKLLDYSSLPIWVDKNILKIIKKATNINPQKRYITCSEMMMDITKVKKHSLDWNIIDDYFILNADVSYRIVCDNNIYHAEKKKHSSWKRVNTINESQDYKTLIQSITKLINKK